MFNALPLVIWFVLEKRHLLLNNSALLILHKDRAH